MGLSRLKILLPYLLLTIVGLLLVVQLFPLTHPFAGIHLPFDEQLITTRAARILDSMGVRVGGLTIAANLRPQKTLVRQVEQQLGMARANALLRDSIPGYIWEVSWKKIQPTSFGFGKVDNEGQDSSRETGGRRDEIILRLSTQGGLLGFERKIPDSLKLPWSDSFHARQIAEAFLLAHTGFIPGPVVSQPPQRMQTDSGMVVPEQAPRPNIAFERENGSGQFTRANHEFVWSFIAPHLGDTVLVTLTVAADLVTKYAVDYKVPAAFTEQDPITAHQILVIVLYVTLIVILLVAGFRRIRAYEIAFRTALVIGILVGLLFGLEVYLKIHEVKIPEILMAVLFTSVFFGGGMVLLWAVSESITRETWGEKFLTIDLLRNGHFFHSKIGASIVRGISMGVMALGVWLAGAWLANMLNPLWAAPSEDALPHVFGSPSPALMALGHSIPEYLYVFVFFVMFAVPLVRRKVSSPWLLIPVAALVFGLPNWEGVHPLPIGIVLEMLVGFFIVVAYYRGDALAGYIALLTFGLAKETSFLFLAGNAPFFAAGWILTGCWGVLLLSAIAAQFRTREITDFDGVTPALARYISERQRLQQELEIARQVQMSFLPKTDPVVPCLDIASRCAPAQEVGGDYYDFIELEDGRLGVAVGDVSGKGTQAAFYMTLTKGFLRALANSSSSPAAVLTQVNRLFYENVRHGVFISMIYSIFDTVSCSMTIARAGHNPVLMRKTGASGTQVINQGGLALGLNAGEVFHKAIQELTIPYQVGDLFVLYTDGFTEAMNKGLEEFGEDRLCRVIDQCAHCSAKDIMETIFKDIRRFTGNTAQHDDMTIVVVKVL